MPDIFEVIIIRALPSDLILAWSALMTQSPEHQAAAVRIRQTLEAHGFGPTLDKWIKDAENAAS